MKYETPKYSNVRSSVIVVLETESNGFDAIFVEKGSILSNCVIVVAAVVLRKREEASFDGWRKGLYV